MVLMERSGSGSDRGLSEASTGGSEATKNSVPTLTLICGVRSYAHLSSNVVGLSLLCLSLAWMMENDVTNVIFETFSVEVVDPETKRKDRMPLCENGENRDVDEDNKAEYVKLMAEWRLKFSVMMQVRKIKRSDKRVFRLFGRS